MNVAPVEPKPAFVATATFKTITDIVEAAKKAGQMMLAFDIASYIRPVLVEDGVLHINVEPGASPTLCKDLRLFLSTATGKSWDVSVVETPGRQTLKEEAKENNRRIKETLTAEPLVDRILKTFPGAQVETFHTKETDTAPPEEELA